VTGSEKDFPMGKKQAFGGELLLKDQRERIEPSRGNGKSHNPENKITEMEVKVFSNR